MRDDGERLLDILDDIGRIRRHLPRSREQFDNDEVIQAALTRWIQNIGEAAGKVSAELRATYPDVPWREMAGMRHRVVHDYAFVNLDVVWRVCTVRVHDLESQVRTILDELEK